MRLKKHIYFIKELDNAWTREGDYEKSLDDLKQVTYIDHVNKSFYFVYYSPSKACFLRGLNPTNLTRDEMIEWLNLWISISKNVKGKCKV